MQYSGDDRDVWRRTIALLDAVIDTNMAIGTSAYINRKYANFAEFGPLPVCVYSGKEVRGRVHTPHRKHRGLYAVTCHYKKSVCDGVDRTLLSSPIKF